MIDAATFPARSDTSRREWRGFSLIEVMFSILIVGGMLVVALNTVGSAQRTAAQVSGRARAEQLAGDLMAEILTLPFEEPTDAVAFGREAGESATSRLIWDDVDDFDGWTASPPQDSSGAALSELSGWTRSVAVEWVDPADLTLVSGSPTGVKRITVTIQRGSEAMATMVAIRTEAWPTEDESIKVLFVVMDATLLTLREQDTLALMESWGLRVTVASATESQAALESLMGNADTAYISCMVDDLTLGTKLQKTTKGVVFEPSKLVDEFGLVANTESGGEEPTIDLLDNTHYVTTGLSVGPLAIASVEFSIPRGLDPKAPGLVSLATLGSGVTLGVTVGVVDQDGALVGGTQAAGRRVMLLPWSGKNDDITKLTADGKTLMRRSIEWASNKE